MPKLTFEKATKTKSKLRMAFTGPAKSGKTYTALVLATALADGGRIGLIDTERRSSRKYADIFEFDVVDLEDFHPNTYIEAMDLAQAAGYAVVIIDSLSHAWIGKKGVLELHDEATARSQSKNSWAAWRNITPLHHNLIDKMLDLNCHVIVTMRSKMEYIQTEDDRGKTTIQKVGLAPVQRQGMEYEFDILAEMHHDHRIVIGDTRCPAIDGLSQMKPDGAWFQPILDWLSDGTEAPKKGNSAMPSRPYAPETVKKAILKRASKGSQVIAKQGHRGLICGNLEAIWVNQTLDARVANRHSVLNFLFGDPSSEKLTTGQCNALNAWLMEKQPVGPDMLNAYAVAEANAIVNLWNEHAGQQRLEMPSEAEEAADARVE